MEIRYAVGPCVMGQLLVAATERGVAAVYLGDSERQLRSQLKREFPMMPIREDRKGLERWVEPIREFLSGGRQALDLPLEARATAFQRRVWEELRRIPRGATRSYSEIARAIGRPRAVRAVARACATNPVSIVIPCHRVVGKDGALTGYRWGLGRKRALLEMERAKVPDRGARASLRYARKQRSHHKAQPEKAHGRTNRAKKFAEIR